MSRVLVFVLTLVMAQPLLASGGSAPESASQAALLLKVQAAARELDYAGIYTYQQGVTMTSSRVVHLVDGTGERERVEILDGAPREFLRHNDIVRSLLPERKVVVIEQRRGERFPSLLLGDGRDLDMHYHMDMLPDAERVAGRDCTPLRLRPRDARRYGHLLCIDTKTHLLLKAQTVSASNEVIDQVAFSSLTMGEDAARERVGASWDLANWRVIEVPMEAIDLSEKGWRIPPPAGFDVFTQISRPLRGDDYVSQIVLSDGLAAISVFVEPYDPERHSAAGQGGIHQGALSVFRKRIGDYWLTALGQVPADTLRELAEQVEYVPLAQ